MQRAGEREIADWENILVQLRAEREIERFCVLTTQFIDKLYHMSGNSILAMLYHSTLVPQQRMYQIFIEKNGTAPVLRNAEEIFAHVRARDAAAASRCMQETMRLPLKGDMAIV